MERMEPNDKSPLEGPGDAPPLLRGVRAVARILMAYGVLSAVEMAGRAIDVADPCGLSDIS